MLIAERSISRIKRVFPIINSLTSFIRSLNVNRQREFSLFVIELSIELYVTTAIITILTALNNQQSISLSISIRKEEDEENTSHTKEKALLV
jgi:hypothetical protein